MKNNSFLYLFQLGHFLGHPGQNEGVLKQYKTKEREERRKRQEGRKEKEERKEKKERKREKKRHKIPRISNKQTTGST